MATKRDEPSLIQQRIHSKREEPSQSQLKMASRKEEPSPGQLKMANKKEDPSVLQQRMASKREDREPSQGHQGDVAAAAAPGSLEHQNSRSGNTVLKSGPLFLSSKGIGWTSWKKRWFILTHTSLVFFRSDPNAVSQKGNEVNLTLGGIDLNNSGSVIVKADKKLITVQFQDGPDGRTFTLKAETLDDLYEWKAALENALSQAPSSANAMGQNGIFRNDQSEEVDASKEPANDKPPVRSTVIGRPVLLALEDVDGAPTFLEKALKFIEKHGVRVEGILRQAADVEDVKRRIQEYEQGKTEFSSEEDAHVIGDCVKYILRELPSSPVPASCCNALLEACRTQRGSRVNAMRLAVLDTFPEPNRHLLQRILMMMQVVASHKNENLMSTSAVAACMAPLLLRPLLAGDCEIETDFDVGGDGSMQLLQAAAAANHAQAIVITLLEEYDQIFGEGSISSDIYSDSEESGSESEEAAEDDSESYDEDESYEDDECDDGTEGSDVSNDDDEDEDGDDDDDDDGDAASETGSESGHSVTNDVDVDKDVDSSSSSSESSETGHDVKATKRLSSSIHNPSSENDDSQRSKGNHSKSTATLIKKSAELSKGVHGPTNVEDRLAHHTQIPISQQSAAAAHRARRNAVWGRTSARKNLSMESIDYPFGEEFEIETVEDEKSDLQNRLREEIEGNTKLKASVEKRKKTLQGRQLCLEKEVAILKEELQRERDKRTALESVLNSSQEQPTVLPAKIDEKTKADLNDIALAEADIINLKKTVEDLEVQLNQQLEKRYASMNDSCSQRQPNHHAKIEDKPKGTGAVVKGSGSKQDMYVDKAEFEKGRKQESSLESKHPPPNQQVDHSENNSNRMNEAETDSKKSHASSNSKKLAKKGEEQRSQTANESPDNEKGRGSSQAVASSGKGKGIEHVRTARNREKRRGPDSSQ
ncbi:rho GTPase-activating protein REN1-like isoform X3 [Gossypium arboreum]|uniref:rho GTPase-activating protein REN1-like isoform X3 n=1 Tax=Gossypium arboreum TaxID=29729 RepID=UPI0022F17DAB|nr:rho GTPase-activating protein REN1-like isoform X3 [Gossypium arboreum]